MRDPHDENSLENLTGATISNGTSHNRELECTVPHSEEVSSNSKTVGAAPKTNGAGGTASGPNETIDTTVKVGKFAALATIGRRPLVYHRSVLVIWRCPSTDIVL